ncbi:MAG TPA: hypothetical protein VMD28_05750, partial [Acidimicrobiales bacterium]|nr:hypothetical protein [Acidimicrobiales bacterium]
MTPVPRSSDPSASLPRAGAEGAWVLDLDGVVWLAPDPIPGAGEAVGLLRAAGARVVFASNNSSPTVEDLVARLGAAGIPATPDDILTSGQAAASLLEAGS